MRNSTALKSESVATTAPDDVLPSAKDVMRQVAEIEAKKAVDYLRKQKAEQAEKKALLDQLSKPSGLSEEEKKKRAAAVINRAVKNGLTEVQVHRFPKELCTDFGRAINQQEPGWENANRITEGNVSALVRSLASARIQAAVPGGGFSGRRTW